MEKTFGVAVKALIQNDEGKFLVIFKSDNEDIGPNEIDIPGGRVKFGEEVETCLLRKVKEETGLEVRLDTISKTWSLVKENFHLIGITFIATSVGGKIKLSNEHTLFRWVDKNEIINGDYPKWIKKEFSSVSISK